MQLAEYMHVYIHTGRHCLHTQTCTHTILTFLCGEKVFNSLPAKNHREEFIAIAFDKKCEETSRKL